MNIDSVIPEHNEGAQSNTESSVELSTEEEAKEFFNKVKERLLRVSEWHHYAGAGTADFRLINDQGNSVDRTPKEGDYFEINIPGPGTISGEGNDWVRVEKIEEDEHCIGIRVRPAPNPTNENTDVAHFFDEQSTSSFVVKRESRKITAGVYGRNEKPNTQSEKLIDKIRNTAIATGAVAGLSKLQWKSLVQGLLKNDHSL